MKIRKFPIINLLFACFFLIALLVLISSSLIHTASANTSIVSDSFGRSVSSGWGSADTGGAYTITGSASDFAVNGTEGTMTAPTSSTSRQAVLTGVSNQEQDVTVRFKTDKVSAGTSQEYFILSRYVSSTLMYRAKIRLTPTNGVTVQGSKVVSGTETFIGTQATVSGLTYSANSYIRVRAKFSGASPTTIQIKAWDDAATEPETWSYTSTDSEATLQTTGGVGLRMNMPASTSNAPIVATFDDFNMTTTDVVATPTPTSTPTPTPSPEPQSGLSLLSDTFTRTSTSSWGSPDSGGNYQVTSGIGSAFNVNGTAGTINSETAALTRSNILNNSSQQDLDFKFKVKIDKIPTGNSMEVFWQGRRVDPSNLYRGKVRLTNGSTVTLQATKVVGGTETLLGTQATTGITLSADTYVYIRSQVTGVSPTTIKMKAWLVTDPEPIAWQYTTTDSETVLQGSGAIGFRTNAPSSITNAPILTTFDDISVTTQDAQINTPIAPPQSGTTIISDVFSRTLASGWGSADTGGAYTVSTGSSSNFSVNGAAGSMVSTAGTSRANYLGDVNQQDVDILFKVKTDKIPTGNATEAFFIARRISPNTQYRGKIRFTASSGVTLQASSVVNGTETLIGSQASTGITYTADTFIWVRAQVLGSSPTNIYMKAWGESATEPVSWQYIVSDYEEKALQTPGSIGFRVNTPSSVTNSPITTSFDNISVTTDDIEIYDPSTAPTPTPTPPGPSSVTVSINLASQFATSKLRVGTTHTQESINSNGDADAMNRGKTLLENGLYYQNQHIIGFGASNLWDDPSKGVASWNWSALDRRVKLMRDTNSVPVLTLCCAPTWMVDASWSPGKYNGSNTDWGQLEKAPLDIYEADFAYMIQKIVERYDGVNTDSNGVPYPKIIRFQVWNEMKGFWDRPANRWNYDKYNRMYGQIYDTIKTIRPEAQIGGPYVRLSKYLYPSGIKVSTVTDSSYGTVDKRDLDVITKWLTWLNNNKDADNNLKAQFITLDAGTNVKDVTDGTFPSDIWAATKLFSDVDSWLTSQMATTIGTQLPIWWAEDYVGKVNGDPTLITSETHQPSALAMLLYRHVTGGSSTSLRWGPEEQVNNAGVAQGNKQNLFTSTQHSGGGQPFENYNIYKYFNDYFYDGTVVYNVSISPATDELTVLSSSLKTLLINKRNSSMGVTLSANSTTSGYTLSPYEVKLVDVPQSIPTPIPTPPVPSQPSAPSSPSSSSSSSSSSSGGSSTCLQNYKYCPNTGPLLGSMQVISSDNNLAKLLLSPKTGDMELLISIEQQKFGLLSLLFPKIPYPWQQGYNTASEIYNYSAVSAFNGYPVLHLPRPATAIISYDPKKIKGVNPKLLRIGYYDTAKKRWRVISSNTVLDTKNHTVANTIRLFRYYAVLYPRR
jgi:hypothetical protein